MDARGHRTRASHCGSGHAPGRRRPADWDLYLPGRRSSTARHPASPRGALPTGRRGRPQAMAEALPARTPPVRRPAVRPPRAISVAATSGLRVGARSADADRLDLRSATATSPFPAAPCWSRRTRAFRLAGSTTAAAHKKRDLNWTRLILLLAATHTNRQAAAEAGHISDGSFELRTKATLATLAAGHDPGADAIVSSEIPRSGTNGHVATNSGPTSPVPPEATRGQPGAPSSPLVPPGAN